MGRDSLGDSRTTSGCDAGIVNGLVCNRQILPAPTVRARKQVTLRLLPAPVFAQSLEQCGAERDVPGGTALAEFDVDHHPGTVNIADRQQGYFGTSHSG